LKELGDDADRQEFKTKADEIIQYMKTLSPSGIELEFIGLATFEFDDR